MVFSLFNLISEFTDTVEMDQYRLHRIPWLTAIYCFVFLLLFVVSTEYKDYYHPIAHGKELIKR